MTKQQVKINQVISSETQRRALLSRNYAIIMSISDVHLFGHLLLRVPITVLTLQLNSRTSLLSPVLASSYLHIIFKFLAVNVNVNRAEFFAQIFWQIFRRCISRFQVCLGWISLTLHLSMSCNLRYSLLSQIILANINTFSFWHQTKSFALSMSMLNIPRYSKASPSF